MAQINDTLWEMRDLYRQEQDPDRRQALQQQYDAALDATLALADKSLGANTEKYQEAVDGLDGKIQALKKVKRELGDIAAAIRDVAAAVDAFVKVAKFIAMPG